MKSIYNKRAKLLFGLFESGKCDLTVSDMIKKLFQSDPSFTEQADCEGCIHANPPAAYPLVALNNEIFRNDFTEFERAIIENLPEKLKCRRCNNEVECKREFSPHIFIEVITKSMRS